MNRETTILKLTCLLGPLAAAILSFHAWGEPLRNKADWYWMRKEYTEHHRIGFDIRVRRGSKAHESAEIMLRKFLDTTLLAYGSVMGLKDPRKADPSHVRRSVLQILSLVWYRADHSRWTTTLCWSTESARDLPQP